MEACSAEQANELALLAKERADEPSTLRVVFRPFLPRVQGWRTGGGNGGGDGGGAQWDKIA